MGDSARKGEKGAKGDSRTGRAGISLAEAPDEASHSSFSQIGCFHGNLMLQDYSCSISEQSLRTGCKSPGGWGGGCRGRGLQEKDITDQSGQLEPVVASRTLIVWVVPYIFTRNCWEGGGSHKKCAAQTRWDEPIAVRSLVTQVGLCTVRCQVTPSLG